MTFKKDISDKIKSDFGDNAPEAFAILDGAIAKTEYLNVDRIIRCILYLAEKDIGKLNRNIDVAVYDPRDVMLRAEYVETGNPIYPKRIQDFNKPFGECEIDLKE